METKRVLEIAQWREAPRPIVRKIRPRRHRAWSPTAIGILSTLSLHTLLVPTAILGSRAQHPHTPDIQEPGALARSSAGASENLVLLTPSAGSSAHQVSEPEISSLPALSNLIRVSPLPDPPSLLNIERVPLDEDSASQTAVESEDATEQARLYGIYTGQIQARINRIWRRPRTPVTEALGKEEDRHGVRAADDSFQCRAQIVQDAAGNVQEILLLRCNGSPAWQHSLVIAIGQASPLPAPPSRSVFTHSLTLDFVGLSYAPGVAEDDYEEGPIQVAQTQDGER